MLRFGFTPAYLADGFVSIGWLDSFLSLICFNIHSETGEGIMMQARQARYFEVWHNIVQRAARHQAARLKLILRLGYNILYQSVACLVRTYYSDWAKLNKQIWHAMLCTLFWFPLRLWIPSPTVMGAHPAPSIIKKPVFYPVSRMCHLIRLIFYYGYNRRDGLYNGY